MEKIRTQLLDLGKTIQKGQSASLISAPAIAKSAATQSFIILQQLTNEVELLQKRLDVLEAKSES